MSDRQDRLAEIVRKDPRYAYEAYVFIGEVLGHLQGRLGRGLARGGDAPEDADHVSGQEVAEGVRELALEQFGLMARTVLKLWGVRATDDIGNIVFNMIDAGELAKTDRDSPEDFRGLFDLDKALTEGFRIPPAEIPRPRRSAP